MAAYGWVLGAGGCLVGNLLDWQAAGGWLGQVEAGNHPEMAPRLRGMLVVRRIFLKIAGAFPGTAILSRRYPAYRATL